MNNKIMLMCTECDFSKAASPEKKLINKIVMWNHMKKAHPSFADAMTRYKIAPNKPYIIGPA